MHEETKLVMYWSNVSKEPSVTRKSFAKGTGIIVSLRKFIVISSESCCRFCRVLISIYLVFPGFMSNSFLEQQLATR